MKKMNNQKGFTLIELVVVIVILGILAATAAPKFIDLQDDARNAVLQGVEGSMRSAAALVHSKSLIEGNNDDAPGVGVDIDVNGDAVLLAYGYPRSTATAVWTPLLDVDDTTHITMFSNTIYVTSGTPNAPTSAPTNCFVSYAEATGTTSATAFNFVLNRCND